jgi:virginiamycin A acetyltransferase
MRHDGRITRERDTAIQYHQFTQSGALRFAMAAAGVVSWPLVLPLALLSRLSDFIFVTCSQLLSLFPYLVGTIVRYEFYRFTLRRCGHNVMVGFGTTLLYRDIEIGDNVLIGMYNTVHHCDFGSWVLTAEGCRFLSGARYHHFDRMDVPMALQGGSLRRIHVADDCWIGANAVVMADVASGSVVAAGAVVTQQVEPRTIVGGVPARVIGRREAA